MSATPLVSGAAAPQVPCKPCSGGLHCVRGRTELRTASEPQPLPAHAPAQAGGQQQPTVKWLNQQQQLLRETAYKTIEMHTKKSFPPAGKKKISDIFAAAYELVQGDQVSARDLQPPAAAARCAACCA